MAKVVALRIWVLFRLYSNVAPRFEVLKKQVRDLKKKRSPIVIRNGGDTRVDEESIDLAQT